LASLNVTREQVGAVLCATDPVAVVALLRDLGASKKLSTVIEGESLFNDGTAIVVFKLFFELAKGATYNATEVVVFFLQVRTPKLHTAEPPG
jgi:NhaP-type Na+/H+ or K+/H+ antiporter